MNLMIPKQTLTTAIIVFLAILWMREFTLRRAIHSAANFMAPFSKQSEDNWEIWKYRFGPINESTKTILWDTNALWDGKFCMNPTPCATEPMFMSTYGAKSHLLATEKS